MRPEAIDALLDELGAGAKPAGDGGAG
jgi:hypothetical protein